MHMNNQIYDLAREKIAPVLTDYVYWVMREAEKRSISQLYFLARDGYILREIAEKICTEKHIHIACRYLYCSRASLRMPSYHIIGEEAYDLLFAGGYYVKLQTIFERAEIPQNLWVLILQEAGFATTIDVEQQLSSTDLRMFREKFRESETFCSCVMENSKKAYQDAMGYFEQEGLLRQTQIAIVDSGWTGSMQRSLRKLLQSKGFKGKMVGFYFGMYAQPKEPADGEYLTWYFSANSEKNNKILFCNNLFECFLSAPHGMTLRYRSENGVYMPVLNEPPENKQLQMIFDLNSGILNGSYHRVAYGMTIDRTESQRIFRKLMGRPSRKIVEICGNFLFCDDTTENYYFALASETQRALLKNYQIPKRILRKIQGQQAPSMAELYWPYGVIVFESSRIKRIWYWCNVWIWQWLKYTLKRG